MLQTNPDQPAPSLQLSHSPVKAAAYQERPWCSFTSQLPAWSFEHAVTAQSGTACSQSQHSWNGIAAWLNPACSQLPVSATASHLVNENANNREKIKSFLSTFWYFWVLKLPVSPKSLHWQYTLATYFTSLLTSSYISLIKSRDYAYSLNIYFRKSKHKRNMSGETKYI